LTFDLANLSLLDILRCSSGMRRATETSRSIEEAAQRVVRTFYESFATRRGESQCTLVRFYRTQAYGELPKDLQNFAQGKLAGMRPTPEMRSLVLLATVGDLPEWNDRRNSVAHKAIPLPSVDIVEQAPMIAQLIRSVGFEIAEVVNPRVEILQDDSGKTHNVFHVLNAVGSPFIPAQDEFVLRYGVRSVVGFGGLLTTGEFFAVVMFSKVEVPEESARRFRSIALDLKAILFSFAELPVFSQRD